MKFKLTQVAQPFPLSRGGKRQAVNVTNAITQATGGAHTCQEDGLGNTTPYVVYEFE
nr:MAG TPA: hypothetical protein [Caudoviricetes sp.]